MSCSIEREDAIWEAAETGVVSEELRRHLDGCESCRVALRELTPAMQGFAALREVRSPDPRSAVRAELAGKGVARRVPVFVRALAVACCLVLMIALWSARRSGDVVRRVEEVKKPAIGGEEQKCTAPAPANSVRVASGDAGRKDSQVGQGSSNRNPRRHAGLAGKRSVRPNSGAQESPWLERDEILSVETIPVETVTVIVPCDRVLEPGDSNPEPRYVRILEEVRVVRARDIPPLAESPAQLAELRID
ncbi:MAG: hypothetical protein Q7T82_09610 [Armatimonadota bacterium]|nr:hypothetical protein [Armatimonadota bacterium]